MLRNIIHPKSPYDGFVPLTTGPDYQGWGSEHPIFESLIVELLPRLIIEVGTWKGMSAINMASLIKRHGVTECEIVCVDTWLGSYENWEHHFDSLQLENGYPTLYRQFMTNVVVSGHDDIITPFPISSNNAAVFLQHKGVSADLVYVDAGHDYVDAKADINVYWLLLRRGGVLFGDDYYPGTYDGVVAAVQEFATEQNLPVSVNGGKWMFPKP
jgi:hypothetical protein